MTQEFLLTFRKCAQATCASRGNRLHKPRLPIATLNEVLELAGNSQFLRLLWSPAPSP